MMNLTKIWHCLKEVCTEIVVGCHEMKMLPTWSVHFIVLVVINIPGVISFIADINEKFMVTTMTLLMFPT